MTAKEKKAMRLAIAQDVINQLSTGAYYPVNLEYVAYANCSPGRVTGLAVEQLRNDCRVCAIGAVWVSSLHLSETKVAPQSGLALLRKQLEKYFTPAQIYLIEAAYEGTGIGEMPYTVSLKDEESAIAFYEKCDQEYFSKANRSRGGLAQFTMAKIMQNIIENDGTFKPKGQKSKKKTEQ